MHNRKQQISNLSDIRADPEVVATAKRRTFSKAEKLRILGAADACAAPGDIGALLWREGIYSRKSDAMTPAQRARRYRAKKNAEQLSRPRVAGAKVAGADARLIALQVKYDIERQLNVELKNSLAARPQQALPKQTKSTREILNMKKTIHELERIVSAIVPRSTDCVMSSQRIANCPAICDTRLEV